jgi:hypothetical protein
VAYDGAAIVIREKGEGMILQIPFQAATAEQATSLARCGEQHERPWLAIGGALRRDHDCRHQRAPGRSLLLEESSNQGHFD